MNDNLETTRSLYAAFAAGDIPTVLSALAPDVRWTEAEGGPYGGVSVGLAEEMAKFKSAFEMVLNA